MRKNQIRNVILHAADSTNWAALATQISKFHVAVVERRLVQSGFSVQQRLAVIDKILLQLKSQANSEMAESTTAP